MISNDFDPSEWLTQEQIATILNVPIVKVWEKVRTLGPAGAVKTRVNPMDRRQLLVHKDDIALIKQAIFN